MTFTHYLLVLRSKLIGKIRLHANIMNISLYAQVYWILQVPPENLNTHENVFQIIVLTHTDYKYYRNC